MKILVVASKDFDNYNELVRNLVVAIEDAKNTNPDDKNIVFVHSGRAGGEIMVTEFIGKTQRFLSQKGYTVKEELVNNSWRTTPTERLTADHDMISKGADVAYLFVKNSSKRVDYCARILGEFGIPSRYVKG